MKMYQYILKICKKLLKSTQKQTSININAKLITYILFRDLIRKCMLFGGLTPHKSSIRPSRIIALYGLFLLIVIITKLLFFCMAHIKNILILTQAVGLIFSFMTIILKMSVCLVYREDFLILENELGQKFEEEFETKESQPVLLKKISVYTRFMYIVGSLLCISVSMYSIVPIINMLKTKKYRLIYPGKYPFSVVPGTTIYWMIYLFEVSIPYFFLTVMTGVDNAFGLYCFQICGLLRLAARRLMDIQPNSPNYKDQVRECVELHHLVLKAKDSLQRAYGIMIIWIYITNSIIMCTIMWQANQLKKVMTVSRALHFVGFVALKLMQSFTYAYYGSLVSRENDNYQEAIYMSDWPGSGNVRLMKDLLLILTQPIVTLRACGFFSMTMQFFEKIVNTTISYFFLLQTLEDKE